MRNSSLHIGTSYRITISAVVFFLLLSLVNGCVYAPISIKFPEKEELREEVIMTAERGTSNKILILDIDGIMTSEETSNIFKESVNMPAEIRERLDKASKDDNVRAVVLRINSPGGEVTASDIVHREISQFKKETGKKVVACLMDTATSGAYYVAVSADKIVAHRTTVTGSIGVIMYLVNVEGLFDKIGLRAITVRSGDKKDIGSPVRPMTDEEREILQKLIDEMYQNFVTVVDEGRPNLTREQVLALADGRIFSAREAHEKGLVDVVGYLEDAVALAKRDAGIEHANVIIYKRPGEYMKTIYSLSGGAPTINILNIDGNTFHNLGRPRFFYLWWPDCAGQEN